MQKVREKSLKEKKETTRKNMQTIRVNLNRLQEGLQETKQEDLWVIKLFKGMDVGHKDNNPLNNDPKNLKMEDPSKNRREPRLREQESVQDKHKKEQKRTTLK